MPKQRLSGWGRTAWTVSDTTHPVSESDLRDVISGVNERGVISRGLGRSYGAAAQNAGGQVLLMANSPVGPAVSLDPISGLLTAPAGMSLDDVLKYSVPRGWFVPVTPGTRFVTVGCHRFRHPRQEPPSRRKFRAARGVSSFDAVIGGDCHALSARSDRKSTRLNSSHSQQSRMPSSA